MAFLLQNIFGLFDFAILSLHFLYQRPDGNDSRNVSSTLNLIFTFTLFSYGSVVSPKNFKIFSKLLKYDQIKKTHLPKTSLLKNLLPPSRGEQEATFVMSGERKRVQLWVKYLGIRTTRYLDISVP